MTSGRRAVAASTLSFKPIPDEEGTEMRLAASVCVDALDASNRSPMRRGLKSTQRV